MTKTELTEIDEAKCQHCFDEMYCRKDTNPFLSKLFNDYYPNRRGDHNDLMVRNYTGGTFTCENKLRAYDYFESFNSTICETDKENGGTQVFINFYGNVDNGWKKFIIQFLPQIKLKECPLKQIHPKNSLNKNENKWRRFLPYDLGYIFTWDGEKYVTSHQPNKNHKLYQTPTTLTYCQEYDMDEWKEKRKIRITELQKVLNKNNIEIKLMY